jgi:hypothetical protein
MLVGNVVANMACVGIITNEIESFVKLLDHVVRNLDIEGLKIDLVPNFVKI